MGFRLVAGGRTGGLGAYLTSAELHDPATGTFSPTGSRAEAHNRPVAALLPDGRVLIAGGQNIVPLASAELYDPATGFATGGGWIIPGNNNNSDPGDFLPDLDGSSKATFGFVVRYQNGAAEVPSGQLEFQYRVGDFNLHSAEYEWLVVTNSNWAKFQGLATIKDMPGLFPFRVDARHGNANGGNQPDRFVIKVWPVGSDPDAADNDPIYKASGDLEGGKIKIHGD